ncbi:TPR and ankyrin repeat-containing protein 1-like isoform X2 [Dreissena polymorpha]|nr:TPR and ankyrin repeat-containing protein 1-like isoform X2 [Dreissena polymorpha]
MAFRGRGGGPFYAGGYGPPNRQMLICQQLGIAYPPDVVQVHAYIMAVKQDAGHALNNNFLNDAHKLYSLALLGCELCPTMTKVVEERPKLLCNQSLVCLKLHRFEDAEEYAQTAITVCPAFVKGYWRAFQAVKAGHKEALNALIFLSGGMAQCLSAGNTNDLVDFVVELCDLMSSTPRDETRLINTICSSGIGSVPVDTWQTVVCRLAQNHKWESLAMLFCGRHSGPSEPLEGVAFKLKVNCSGVSVGTLLADITYPALKSWGEELAMMLLVNGASEVEIGQKNNMPTLHYVVTLALRLESIRLLNVVAAGYRGQRKQNVQNVDGNTALHVLALSEKIDTETGREILDLLLTMGCDVTIRNNKNQTALDCLKPTDKAFSLLKQADKQSVEQLRGALEQLKSQGNEALKSRDYAQALKFYDQGLLISQKSEQLYKEAAVLYSNRANVCCTLGHHEEALANAMAATTCDKTYTKGYWWNGKALQALNNPDASFDVYMTGYEQVATVDKITFLLEAVQTLKLLPKASLTERYKQLKVVDTELWPQVLGKLSVKADWKTLAYLILGANMENNQRYEQYVTVYEIPNICSGVAGQHSTVEVKASTVFEFLRKCESLKSTVHWLDATLFAVCHYGKPTAMKSLCEDESDTILHAVVRFALTTARLSLLQEILNLNIQTEERNGLGDTVFHTVTKFHPVPDPQVLKKVSELLLKKGFNVASRNSEGKLPVEYLDKSCPGFVYDIFKPADPDKIIGDIHSFKLKGNDLFKAGNAYAALDCYSNAIGLLNSMSAGLAMQKMGSHEIAVVYGNRAECFLKLGFYQQAHDDAMQSVSIDEHWYKAHIRVGKAMKGMAHLMISMQAFCNAYFCPISEDKVKVEILVELAPVLQTLNFHGRLDKIPIEDGHIWAQASYKLLSKNDWDSASAAFHQYEQSKCKQPHLPLTLKPFCAIDKLKVHSWCLGLIQYLLECGADKKTLSLDDRDTYMHAVIKITLVVGKSTELLKYLLKRYCCPGYSDQHKVDRSGNTVLHTATQQRNAGKKMRQDVIEMLLKRKVDPSACNQSDKVALDYLPSGEYQSRELLRMAMFNKGKLASTVGDNTESNESTTASESAEVKQHKQKPRRKDPCNLCEDLYQQAAVILQKEVIEGFDKLTKILAEEHSSSRHEGIVSRTVSLVVQTLSKMQNLEHINSLLCIPIDYIIIIVERLAMGDHWRQLDMLVRKYRNTLGKDKLKAFATNMTVVRVINEPSLAKNEDLKLQIVLNLLNSNASFGSDGGQLAMKYAVAAEHYRVLYELIKRGADTRALSVSPGDTPMHAAVQIALGKDKNLTILEHLLTQYDSNREENGHLDPEQLDQNGDCLFHLVAKAKNISQAVKVTDLLCTRRISGDYVNMEGKLPQDYIMKKTDRRLQYLRDAKSVPPTNKQMFSRTKTATTTTPIKDDIYEFISTAESEAKRSAVAQEITKTISARETRIQKISTLISLLPETSHSVFSTPEIVDTETKSAEEVKEVNVNDLTQVSNITKRALLLISPSENKVKENAEGLYSDSESDDTYLSASEEPNEKLTDLSFNGKPSSEKAGTIGNIAASDDTELGKAIVNEVIADGSGDHSNAGVEKKCLETTGNANKVDIHITGEKSDKTASMSKDIETNNICHKGTQDHVDGPIKKADDIVEVVEEKEDSGDDADDEETFVVDAEVFDNLEWEVECTTEVWKTLRDKRVLPELKRRIVHKIQLLASGNWQPHLCKKLVHVRPTLNLFEAKFSKGRRIIWELAVAFSPRLSETAERRLHSKQGDLIQPVRGGKIYSEIIRVWDIVMDHNKIYRSVQRINDSHERGKQCIIQKNLRGMRVDQTLQPGVGKRFPMLFAEDDAAKEELLQQNQEIQKYFPPASSNETEYHILKFYSFSSALVSHVLQNIESKVDFPFRVTDLEHAIINLRSKGPILLLGRSGTGKTTCCMYRLWSHFHTYWLKAKEAGAPILPRCVEFVHQKPIEKDDTNEEGEIPDNSEIGKNVTGATGGPMPEALVCTTPEPEEVDSMYDHLHQLFITKNAVLCSEVQKNFRELSHANDLMADNLQHEDENLPPRLQDVKDYAFPMFVTSRQLLLMLDASAGPPFFFARMEDGSLKVDISGWTDAGGPLSILSLLDDESDAEDDMDEFEDSDHEMEMGDNWNTGTTGKAIKVNPRREITYTVFVEEIWRRIKKNTSSYHPSLIWTEIMSFIKGSYEALSKPKGFLDKEEYFELGRKRAPNFTGERDLIYSFFLKYEHFRKQHALFDETDLVHDVFQRLRQLESRPWVIHQIFVDETQDFTQAELCLLIRLCQNPNDMFLTGDTAQSIMRGISFRFSDLRSLFYHAKQSMQAMGKTTALEVPKQVYQLTHNYRSHAGILSLASSILELMVEFFPESFDRLQPDKGLFNGPRPILLESCSFGDLAVLLRGNRRKTSHIEFGAHQAILLVNDAARDSIPEELQLGLILTIYEAKGLEFDDVLLYNFFKDSQASKEWRVVTDFLDRLVQNESAIISSGNLITIDQE